MAKDILVYGDIYSFSAAEFIRGVDELSDSESLVVRINTNGGDPQSTFGMIAKFNEFPGEKIVRVDGKAYSAGFFMCCYADNVEALDVSQFLIHRAAYPAWMESNPELFNDELKSNLKSINDSLLKALKAKIDVPEFEKITGTTLKEIFSMDSRKDVFINAQQAKTIGLVSKINKITPSIAAELSNHYIAAINGVDLSMAFESEQIDPKKIITNNQKPNIMTIEDFKTQHPDAFNSMQADAKTAGINAERARINAWMEHHDVDPDAVKNGIQSGAEISNNELKAFYKKGAEIQVKNDAKAGLKDEAAAIEKIETSAPKTESPKTDSENELTAFEKSIDAKLGLNKEK